VSGIALAAATLLLLAGCAGGADAGQTAGAESTPTVTATETPTPRPTPASGTGAAVAPVIPDVPRTDASIGAAAAAPTVVPVRVEVPDLGVDVAVAPEGTDADGALALPSDPGIASWYRFGPSPWSAAGSTVIASHVDSLEYGIGQFARLTDAAPGTVVLVTAEDGRVERFVVQTVDVEAKNGIDWATVFDRTGPPRLSLITCGGEFDYSTGHYLSNVIVTAVPDA